MKTSKMLKNADLEGSLSGIFLGIRLRLLGIVAEPLCYKLDHNAFNIQSLKQLNRHLYSYLNDFD